MGYSQSWLAVRGKPPAAVLETLGLCGTGTREEIAESPIVGAELPSGWYLVVAGRSGHRLMHDQTLQRLSAGCEVITGDVEEHVMVSVATGWKEAVDLMLEHRQRVLDGIRDRLASDGFDPEDTYRDWIAAFQRIVELSRASDSECVWSAPSHPRDTVRSLPEALASFERIIAHFLDETHDG